MLPVYFQLRAASWLRPLSSNVRRHEMLDTVFRSSVPIDAIEYAGYVLVHCAAIADVNRNGELICPFAVVTDPNGRHVVDFESTSQEEAISKGWATLSKAKQRKVWWAFGREGIFREPDGKGTDVLTVTVWIPRMRYHHSFTHRFGRAADQTLYLIGDTEVFKHKNECAESVEHWDEAALVRGIKSHPQGNRWTKWRAQ